MGGAYDVRTLERWKVGKFKMVYLGAAIVLALILFGLFCWIWISLPRCDESPRDEEVR